MRSKIAAALLLTGSLGLSGCALFLIGAGAAGGYAISKDSVKNDYDLPMDRVYRESLGVVKEMGQVTLEDPKRGLIKAQVNDINVTITVKPLTRRTVELKVKARSDLLMPKVETAQEIYNRIASRL